MTKTVTYFLVCVFLLAGFHSSGAAEKRDALRSVRGDFTQETHLKILARPLVSHGIFAFQAPQSLRWEYHDPLRSIMLMQNGSVEKYVERDGRLERDNGMGVDSMQMILPEISNWLDGRFSDNPVFTAKRTGGRTVILTPKEKGFRAVISSIELHLGAQAGVMDSVTIHEGPEAYTRLTFSNVVLNREIPESYFRK